MLTVPGLAGLLGAGLAVVMLAIALYDARYFIIPDVLVVVGLGLGLAHAFVTGSPEGAAALAGAFLRGVVLALAFWAVRVGYARLRGREGVGLGDVKLALVAGLWLGWLTIAVAIEIAALAALTTVAVQATRGRTVTRRMRIPFGLFFAPAIWLAWLLQAGVLRAWLSGL